MYSEYNFDHAFLIMYVFGIWIHFYSGIIFEGNSIHAKYNFL